MHASMKRDVFGADKTVRRDPRIRYSAHKLASAGKGKLNVSTLRGEMTARLPEKRRENRIYAALTVSLQNARGVTRDMSASGVFFWTNGTHTIGDLLGFSIELKTAGDRMMWICLGDVARTERRGNDVGVAVKIIEAVGVLA